MADDASPEPSHPLTYRDAGVDISAGEKTVELIKPLVRATYRPEVVGGVLAEESTALLDGFFGERRAST